MQSFESFRTTASAVLLASLLSGALDAQGPSFQSPGASRYSTLGQTTRFSREFNPAFGFVIDGVFDYEDIDAAEDGFDLALRLFEFNAAAYVDPDAWAYIVLTSEDLETPSIEEAAVEYIGLSGNRTIKAGRFFVDYGKQMQTHLEELRTLERPLPLREYLGDELAGTGVQYDDWFALGEATPVRFSVGAFGELLPGGEEEEDPTNPFTQTGSVVDNKDFGELSFTARLTGMTDVGETGLVQLGASARWIPDYTLDLEFDDGRGVAFSATQEDLDEVVYGVDLTYGRTDETGTKSLLLGGELVVADGDLSGAADPGTMTFSVNRDRAVGWFVFGDYGFDQFNSAGLQYAMADLREDPGQRRGELDGYYTRNFTEYRRLRFGVTFTDDEVDDGLRFYVQFTNFFGSHSHGLNW